MSENGTPDLSRIVGLILENPKLIEEISSLVRRSDEGSEETEERRETEEVASPDTEAAEPVSAPPSFKEDTYPLSGSRRGNRGRLLGSLKPYLSAKRASAIDTMITVSDVLDSMRGR